jgi:lysophospholipase L1-like esterase
MFRLNNLGRVTALGAVASLLALGACETNRDVVAPIQLTANNAIFQSYVAIGNSITAGYQSGGINDSTQRQSYARLLAGTMNTNYRYASLAMPGCTAPTANTQTGALVTTGVPAGTTPAACSGRTFNTDTTEILTNVAVPGARVLDPITTSTVASNVLTNIILRGKTQVQAALRAKPTFATIWIGNNDVLTAGLSGILVPTPSLGQAGIISTPAVFQSNYDVMMTQLLAGAPGLKGVLIGVAKVNNLPLLSSGALIASSPTIQAGIAQVAGGAVTVHPNCTGSASLINVPSLVSAIRTYRANPATPGAHPPVIVCDKNTAGFPAPIGDIFVLDGPEQTTLNATIDAYNSYISSKATATGFAYYDPNVLFAARRASGQIPAFPNFASTNQTFGTLISLDGVHPSAAAHVLIANELIATINLKYGTTLAPVQ